MELIWFSKDNNYKLPFGFFPTLVIGSAWSANFWMTGRIVRTRIQNHYLDIPGCGFEMTPSDEPLGIYTIDTMLKGFYDQISW